MKRYNLFNRNSPFHLLFIICCTFFISSCQQQEAAGGETIINDSVILLHAKYTKLDQNGKKEIKQSIGTAFAINDKGDFVTNYHVIKEVINSGKLNAIESVSPSKKIHPVKVVFFWAEKDLAIVNIPSWNRPPVMLADSEIVKTKQVIFAVGFPAAATMFSRGTPEMTIPGHKNGTISARRTHSFVQNVPPVHMFEHNAQINGGNSGGPLIDECNRVVGINTLGIVHTVDVKNQKVSRDGKLSVDVTTGIFFSTEVNELKQLLKAEKIDFVEDNSPCVTNQLTTINIAGVSLPISILLAILFVIVVIIFFVLRGQIKKGQIDERDLSHLVKQKMNKYNNQPSQQQSSEKIERDWEGNIIHNPEPGTEQPVNQHKTIILQPEKNIWPKITVTSGRKIILGRDSNADISFVDRVVSREHAELQLSNQSQLQVNDLSSANGTYIDDEKIPSGIWTSIHPGQHLILGKGDERVVFRIELGSN